MKKHYGFWSSTPKNTKRVWCECKLQNMKLLREYCKMNNMKIHGNIFIIN
jgi:hypothetical protein